MTLKSELEVTQVHPNWYHSKALVWFREIGISSYCLAFDAPVRCPRQSIAIQFGMEKLEW